MPFIVEIPAFYVDDLAFDQTPQRPVLVNRFPEPNETQVPIGTNIALDIVDTGPDGIDDSATQVFIDGTLAYDGGVFQTGFTGPASSSTAPEADTRRLVIDPTSDFSSLDLVDVRVVSEINGGAETIDETYSFTIEDLTAPQVLAAQAIELQRVRVSFDEPVLQIDPVNANDALNPANYTLTRLTVPAVSAFVVSIETVIDSAVEIITDIPLTPGALYNLKVIDVEDPFGNPIPNDDVQFIAFIPPKPAGRSFELFDLMPLINRREDNFGTGDLLKFLQSLQDPTDLLLFDIDKFVEIFDPDFAPEQFVDLMLDGLGNPFQFDLSLIDKRRLIDVLVAIYKEKGTDVGIINAIRFFQGLEVRIVPFNTTGWILGESELGEDTILGPSTQFALYAFNVEVDVILTEEQRTRLNFIVEYMKPAHTHFVNLIEPVPPEVIDHLELGLSELGIEWELH